MEYDLGAYRQATARLATDDLDLERFRDEPLDADTLRCLRYMHDVEHHTICYLRDLLLTAAHRDPVVTTFLSFWVYEEYWHGEVWSRVLAQHGEVAGEERIAAHRRTLGFRDRIRPMLMSLGSALAGDDFVAVHMTWGVVNEWTTQAGYGRLARRSGHPLLVELLQRIMRQEGRHIDFYGSEAERRLAASPRAQRYTRVALRRFWAPVGAGVMPDSEVRFLITHLFGDPDGRAVAARIDRRIDRLPGLSGLDLTTRAVSRYAA